MLKAVTCPECKGKRFNGVFMGHRVLCRLCGGVGLVTVDYRAVFKHEPSV